MQMMEEILYKYFSIRERGLEFQDYGRPETSHICQKYKIMS